MLAIQDSTEIETSDNIVYFEINDLLFIRPFSIQLDNVTCYSINRKTLNASISSSLYI